LARNRSGAFGEWLDCDDIVAGKGEPRADVAKARAYLASN